MLLFYRNLKQTRNLVETYRNYHRFRNTAGSCNFSLKGPYSSSRYYCSGKNTDEWTEDVEYLDESGNIIYSGKGIRSVEPGLDDHVMVGGLKKPILNASAVAKLVEIVKRWKWGPDMETQLDKLQFIPNMTHIMQALKVMEDSDASLSLFRWAKRQPWYKPNDVCYITLFDKLNQSRDFDGIQSVFDDMVLDSGENGASSLFNAYNRVIQYLAKAEKFEVAFCCFKKIQESGCIVDTGTYNSLITVFLNNGLPYKAFEIYENMEKAGCSLDASSYELMIPSLAKSGRLDAVFKLFQQMKMNNFRPGFGIFASLVDSMGKAGRLDTSLVDITLDLDLGVGIGAAIVPARGSENHPIFTEISCLAIDAFNAQNNKRYKFVENVTVTKSGAAGYWCRNTFLAKDSDAPYTVKTFQARGFWGICGERIIAFCRLKKTSGDQGDEYPPYINADYKVRQ